MLATMQAAAQEVPAAGGSVASAHYCVMRGWQSRWPLLSPSTTAHSARRRQGPGSGYEEKCTAKSRKNPLPGARHAVLRPRRRERAGARWDAAGGPAGGAAAGGGQVAHGGRLRARARHRVATLGDRSGGNTPTRLPAGRRRGGEEGGGGEEGVGEGGGSGERMLSVATSRSPPKQMAAWLRLAGKLPPLSSCTAGDPEERGRGRGGRRNCRRLPPHPPAAGVLPLVARASCSGTRVAGLRTR